MKHAASYLLWLPHFHANMWGVDVDVCVSNLVVFPRTPRHLSGSPESEHSCAHAFAGVAPVRRRTQVRPAPNTTGVGRGTMQPLPAGATIASRTGEGTCVAKSKVKSMPRRQVVTSRLEPCYFQQACRHACLYAHVHACTQACFTPPALLPTVSLLT